MRLLVLAALATATAACSSPAKPVSGPARAPGGQHGLGYLPSREAYFLDISLRSQPEASMSIQGQSGTVFAFRAPPAAEDPWDVVLQKVDLSVDAAGQKQSVNATPAGLSYTINGALALELKPGQPSPEGARLEDVFQTPMHRIRFSPTGPVDAGANQQHPLVAMSVLVDHGPMCVFALPSVPTERVAVGATWAGQRDVPTNNAIDARVPIEIRYRLEALERCGADECAVIHFVGDTGPRDVKGQAGEMKVSYRFEGRARVDVTRHEFDSADFEMRMTLEMSGMNLPIRGKYEIGRR